MTASLPIWSVYRWKGDRFHRLDTGGVAALTEQQALEIARRLPGAPFYPLVCLAHCDTQHPMILVAELEPQAELERRSRRRLAA